ncbi:phosphatidylinositol-4-phosphate 5-kinase family protein, putative [Ichthyophthirius multifiliis]|uniref:Phosphatidylinositol-4-phosphate 5-kinase family protein, putative n=1 Tax=Ichthyophthirius multifiliis TaxID=5932 RepID=G0QR05_ICHMU|nr:phosphatidylinositol-4-phosphate 5-kinase family protein, putative [Ichthyophthirius multifiliis]EGR32350.1 phosphatidylinositol-4-phosphate 5-kinase family protein, putative [Ichthyophthirius multifiliis]|eukprot:XP_004035836.1 phosphatidylinositol-4-phosphate 5-kinase family protein, putative [Ichthyophthirius multifiliis]
MKKYLILFLFINIYQCEFLDYTDDHLYDCTLIQTEQEQSQILKLHYIERISFVIIPPISVFLSLLIIIIFIKFNKTRTFPGYIFFSLTIADSILNISFFLLAVHSFYFDQSPISSGYFCQINSVMSIIALCCEFMYNLAFSFILTQKLKRALQGFNTNQIYMHAIILSIAVIITTILTTLGYSGLNLFGICSISTKNNYIGITFVFIFIGIEFYTFYFLKKSIPAIQSKDSLLQIVKHYIRYVFVTCIIYTIFGICDFITGLNCIYLQKSYINISITFGNLARLFFPLFMAIIRLSDPANKKYTIYIFYKLKIINMDYDEFILLNTNHKKQELQKQDSWVSELSKDLRTSTIFTMLCSVYMDIKQKKYIQQKKNIFIYFLCISREEDQKKSIPISSLCQDDGQQITQRVISKEVINKRFKFDKYTFQKNNRQQFQIVQIKMTTHSPMLFRNIRDIDIDILNFQKSLDFSQNKEQIQQAFGQADGGRSGEFFFFTYDNQLILKTLKEEELNTFKKNLYQYVTYLNENQTSMITKIYGLYSFQVIKGSSQMVHLLVMKNILTMPKQYILRTYDLKGSKLGRQVIDEQKEYDDQYLRKKVLKENEFIRFEKQIYLSFRERQIVKDILEKDSQFLAKMHYVDYSLLVIKLDYKQYRIDNIRNNQQIFTSYNCLRDDRKNGIYYHLGIIDYLQEYNYIKRIEHNYKKVRYGQQADASIQEPNYYSNRFINQIVKKIF